MLRSVTKKRFVIHSIAINAVLFFVSLCAMEPADPVKNKKQSKSLLQRLKRVEPVPLLVNCGLTHHLIPKEVMALISYHLTLQDIGRLNRVNKAGHWDFEHICDCKQVECTTVACKRLKECIYNTRTKVLGHYATTRNEIMFQHIKTIDGDTNGLFFGKIWPVRDIDSLLILRTDPTDFLKKYMEKYRKYYGDAKRIHKTHCKYFVDTVCFSKYNLCINEAKNLLKIILPGTSFNIYQSSYRKKRARSNGFYHMHTILREISATEDEYLLLVAVGGSIEPYMFKSLYENLSWVMIGKLEREELIPMSVVDKYGKSAQDYYFDKEDRRRYRGGGGIG